MKTTLETLAVELEESQRQWTAGEIPVLTAAITLPQCSRMQPGRIPRRLNRYYRQCARSFLSYCSHDLYPRALAEFEDACRSGAPLPCGKASLVCTITCNQAGIFSLYADCTEWAGTKDALTLRRADTWDLADGMPVAAQDCFARGTRLRALCMRSALRVCEQQQRAGMAVYAEKLSARLRRYFSPRNFYLSGEGFHFFYQPDTIAPAREGCPTFFLPFSEEGGPFWPGRSCTCNPSEIVV